ncbi:MAG: hypothetical protein FWG70_03700 [Oscillospiraceae bacterium]|nr:hypothetical protein [Oscillospiraceae bacterium]
MRKIIKNSIIVSLLAMSLSLAACSGEDDRANDNNAIPDNTPVTTPSVILETIDDELSGDFVVDVRGTKFNLADAVSLIGDEGELTPEQAVQKHNNDEYYSAQWDFMLYQPSLGINYNSLDNPEVFIDDPNTVNIEIALEPPVNTNPMVKFNDGDVLNGLTVKNLNDGYGFGYTYHFPDGFSDFSVSMGYELVGETTMSGYVIAAMSDDVVYVYPGDIYFFPDTESVKDFPLSKTFLGNMRDDYVFWVDDFLTYTDIPLFHLGALTDEEYRDVDLRAIPDDGTPIRVEVTLTDIKVGYPAKGGLRVTARIVGIK